MTAILGADTLTPTTDRATRYLAEFLRDTLNAESKALDLPPEFGERVVIDIREYNAFNFTEFPALAVYRTGSRGEAMAESSAIAAYYLPSMAAQEKQPGIMRWVETRIARALERIRVPFDDERPVFTLLEPMRSEYQIGLLPGTSVQFPFLKVFFDFVEIGA
jgi:hypothetical protein